MADQALIRSAMDKYRKNSERVIRVHGARHDPPDPKRLSKALLSLAAELAAAQDEADAKAAHDNPHQQDQAGEAAP